MHYSLTVLHKQKKALLPEHSMGDPQCHCVSESSHTPFQLCVRASLQSGADV